MATRRATRRTQRAATRSRKTSPARSTDPFARPPTPYVAPRANREPSLTYTIRIRPVAERRYEIANAIGPHWLLNFDHDGETVLKVVHWNGYTRIETLGPGLYGSTAILLRDPKGGIVLLDTKARTYFRADESQSNPVRLPLDRVSVAITQDRIDQGAARHAVLSCAAAPRAQHHSWWIDRAELAPFAADITHVMLGGIDLRSDTPSTLGQLRGLGIPMITEVHAFSGASSSGAVIRSEIIEPAIGPAEPALFRVPRHYVDMRSPKRRAKSGDLQRYVPGTQFSLSTLRRGRTGGSGPFPVPTSVMRGVGPQTPAGMGTGVGRGDFNLPDTGDPGPPPPPDAAVGTDGINVPQCFSATFGSQLAAVVEQRLLDDLKAIVNAVTSRLGEFSGDGGTLTVNWLDQWRATPAVWNKQANAPTEEEDGLYCLLFHPFKAVADPADPAYQPGFVVQLALRAVRYAFAQGTLTSLLTLDTDLSAEVTRVIALNVPDPFGAMQPKAREILVETYIAQRIGTFDITYATSTTPKKTFHDLVMLGLTGINFSFDFRHESVLTTFVAQPTGTGAYTGGIHLHIELPYAKGSATLYRYPSEVYFAALAAVAATAWVLGIPALVSGLGSALVAAGLLLFSDIGYLYVSLKNCHIDAMITFVKEPDGPGPGILRPSVTTLSLVADAVPLYASYLPDTLHQFEGLITTLILNLTSTVTDAIGDEIKDALNGLFRDTLALRFPPLVGPTPPAPLTGWSGAATNDHLYLQGAYDAGAGNIAPPYVTQVDPNVHDRLLATRTQFFADNDANLRRYLGFVLSQNYLNQFINTRWKQGAFNFALDPAQTHQFGQLLGAVLGVPLEKNEGLRVHLWPATSPRTVLTPRGLHEFQGPYAATFFDDIRVCIELENREGDIVEVQLAMEAFTQVGFGGIDPVTQKLDFGHFVDAFFELYFDLDHLGLRIIQPEVQGIIGRGDTFGRLTVADLPSLEPALLFALRTAFASRSDSAVPHDPADRWRLKYAIGKGGSLDVRLFPYRGNLYGWLALVGALIPGVDPKGPLKHGIVDLLPGGTTDILTLDKSIFDCSRAQQILDQ